MPATKQTNLDALYQHLFRLTLPESYSMVSPPDWLSQFANAVTPNIHSFDILSPLGCHFLQVHDIWEITLFASRTEVVGGPQDGMNSHANISVDVKSLLDVFSSIEAISWQSQPLGDRDELGAHLSVEGTYEDHRVWLRITAVAPEMFGVGRRAFVNQQQIEEIW